LSAKRRCGLAWHSLSSFNKAGSFLLKHISCCLLKIDRSTFILLACCLFLILPSSTFYKFCSVVLVGCNAERKDLHTHTPSPPQSTVNLSSSFEILVEHKLKVKSKMHGDCFRRLVHVKFGIYFWGPV